MIIKRYVSIIEAYKNVDCAKCNSIKLENLQCHPSILPFESRTLSPPQSLQLLFDLSFLKGEVKIRVQIRAEGRHLNKSEFSLLTPDSEYSENLQLLHKQKCQLYVQQHNSSYSNGNHEAMIKRYLTICGQTVSIVCLFMLLTMYFTHKVLRNLPGLVLISLAIALMFSQISFLISVYVTDSFLAKALDNQNEQENDCFANEFSSSIIRVFFPTTWYFLT